MNYRKIHNLIIKKAKKRPKAEGLEGHHINPISITGEKKHQGDKVWLTPKEHYVIHQLLVKIHKRAPNLIFALHRLAHSINAREHGIKYHNWIRKRIKTQTGFNNKKNAVAKMKKKRNNNA